MKLILLLLITNMFWFTCFAQVDTISIKNNNLNVAAIKEGSSQYLSWVKDARSGLVSGISMSERKVSFQKINGKDVIVVILRTFNNDSANNKYVYTISDRRSFKTLYNYTLKNNTIEAYDYPGDEIKGDDTVKQNTKRNFSLKFTGIPYCWDLDIETLGALAIKNIGQKMVISFYQPGRQTQPRFYPIEVIGEEQLPAVNNEKIGCWTIKLSFDSENYDLLWISKSTHEFLKLESHSPTDIFNKVKLFNTGGSF